MANDIAELTKEVQGYFRDTIENATHPYPSRFLRRLELHPSGGRYCGVRDMYDWLTEDHAPINHKKFMEVYFTSVGTLVHEIIQRFAGKGGRVWGHWKCQHFPACDYKAPDIGPYHACPSCGSACDYDEIGFRLSLAGDVLETGGDALLDGHSDCLYQDADGNFWCLDYKTCLLMKAQKHRYDGKTLGSNVIYRYQQRVYTTLYHRKYGKSHGIKPKGWLLVYLPRDIPSELAFHGELVSFEEKKEIWKSLLADTSALNTVLNAKDYEAMENVIRTKPCQSLSHYKETMENPYSPCPLLPVCFNNQLGSIMKNEMEMGSDLLPMRTHILQLTKKAKDENI